MAAELPSIAEAIDANRLSAQQWMIFALCALVVLLDGWDTQSIGIIAPLLKLDLRLDQAQVGSIFSIGQFGATVGALSFGVLADRFGRKPLILLATALVAIFTSMTALTHTFFDLAAVRLASGIGLGGAIPCVLALASEYAPKRLRGLMVTSVFAAFPLGGAIGGLVSARLVDFGDWRLVFYVGGILPALVCLAILALIPESVQFLANRGLSGRAAVVLRRLRLAADPGRGGGADGSVVVNNTQIRRLFTGDLATATALLLTMYFFAFATTKIVAVWLPTILQQAGLSLAQAALAQASFNVGAALGIAISGMLVDRYGPSVILAPSLVMTSLFVALLGAELSSAGVVYVLANLVGIFVGIGAAGAHAVAVLIYPPPIRSTGLGLGLASSRFGQVLSPMIIGIMLSANTGGQAILVTVALLPLLSAGAVLILMFGPTRDLICAARRDLVAPHARF